LLLLAMIPVLIAVRESPRRVIRELTPSTLQVLRVARPGTIRALVVLMVAQGLLQPSYGAAQRLVVLRSVQLMSAHDPQSIFGFSSSAVSVGFGFGPLLGGLIASAAGAQVGLIVAATLALLLAAIVGVAAREPQPPRPILVTGR